MRKTLLFFMLLSVKLTFGQLADDFTDGNFTAAPPWLGNPSSFYVNSAKQLQSKLSASAQTVTLVTANNMAVNVKWTFKVRLNFDPSASNQARIYLVADQQELNGPLNGYFIQIGEAGTADSYDLYRQSGNTITKIIDGPPKVRANVNALVAQIRVTRSALGQWELYTNIDEAKNDVLEGSTTDLSFTTTNWFGVSCKYTATRSDGFIFDDFVVEEFEPDLLEPTLLGIKMVDETSIDAIFSEPLAPASALTPANYSLSAIGSPTVVTATALPHVYRLVFASALPTGAYTLTVNQVKDLKGNQITVNNKATLFYVKPYLAKKGDVVLNEILADPLPQVGLPNAEFVELWNTTDHYILLNNWKYGDLTNTYIFGADTLRPKEYLILTAMANVNLYRPFGRTIGLSSWPSLNNDTDVLTLKNPTGAVIDEVAYTLRWYKDELKKAGGYSLELIDPLNNCKGIQNWAASTAVSGGTPGQQNANYQSQLVKSGPRLLGTAWIDELSIRLQFGQYVDSLSAVNPSNYNLNNGIGLPISALPEGPNFTSVMLKFGQPMLRGVAYLLTVTNLMDCAGNLIDNKASTASLFKAKPINKGDLLISEILVNPKSGGADFIEVYNTTDHALDLSELKLANENVAAAKLVGTQTLLMPAGTHWVLTTAPEMIKQQYFVQFPDRFVQMASMPAYNNDKGTVILLSGDRLIDRFDYRQEMHIALLKNADGVALERVSYAKESQEAGNFRSAAATVGYATPSYRNSQEQDPHVLKSKVNLTSKTFSPDGDGFEDLLTINYQLMEPGSLATVNIYTDKGILVRKLERNATISTAGSLVWDGTDDAGQKRKVGIYIVKFDVFTLNGTKESFKEALVLAARLD